MPTPPQLVETFFKQKTHVTLKGKKYTDLKNKVFDRDGWQCVECGSPYNLTLSHREHSGLGGGKGPGDTIENCDCRCMPCHQKEEHGQDGRVKK